MAFSVVLDTCALYPACLRDTLLRLTNAGTFRRSATRHRTTPNARRVHRGEPGANRIAPRLLVSTSWILEQFGHPTQRLTGFEDEQAS